jgi:hypothetical protein
MLHSPTSCVEFFSLYEFSSICRDLYAFYSGLQTVRGMDLISDSTQVPRATGSCGKSFAGRLAQMSLDPVVKLVKTRRKSLVSNRVILQIRLRWREKTIRNGQTKSHIASPGSGADSVRWQDKASTGSGKTMQSGKEKAHIGNPGSGLFLQMPISMRKHLQLSKPYVRDADFPCVSSARRQSNTAGGTA